MTMPSKGRRSIVVDGETFHWRVQDWGNVTIQHASGYGACLIVVPLEPMLPKHVDAAIRFGILHQWKPSQSGSNIWLGFELLEQTASFSLVASNSQPTFDHDAQRWLIRESPRSEKNSNR